MINHVDVRFLDYVWPTVEKFIDDALSTGEGEMTVDQARLFIANGAGDLFTIHEGDDLVGACFVEWMQFPNYRIANVIAVGGKGLFKHWEEMQEWFKRGGATKVRCCCKGAQARLFQTYGFSPAYTMMSMDLV